MQGGYGAYNAYISAATRYGALGAPTLYDHPTFYGSKLTNSWILHTVFVSQMQTSFIATIHDVRVTNFMDITHFLFLKCKLVSLALFMM